MINPELVEQLEKIKQNYLAKTVKQACGNPNCGGSIAIDDKTPTFGSGELDEYGFWEDPCDICARAYELKHPEKGPAWPFAEE